MDLAAVDIIFIILILLLVIRCGLRGFIGEFMSMASVLLGLLGAFFFYENGAVFIRERFLSPNMLYAGVLANIFSFMAVFLIIFILIKILESILSDIVSRIRFGGIDKFLGLLLGLIEGFVLISLVIWLILIQPLFQAEAVLGGSIFARYLVPLIQGVHSSLRSLAAPMAAPLVAQVPYV